MLQLKSFQDIHKGRPGWVVGNGPSLNKMDLAPLKDRVTFGMNCIYLGVEKFGFTPLYYTVEDTFVAEDNSAAINALPYTKLLPEDLKYCLTGGDNVCWVNFVRRYENFPLFSDDIAEKIYWGSTVTYLSVQLAYFMGCDPIFLIGVDFDYQIPTYADGPNITSRENDVNHFHPDYFGPGKRWHHPRLDLVGKAYETARTYIEGHGRRICNAGAGGKLEIFQRMDYREALALGQ